ncbi:MAG: hypothetical protein MK171_11325 [Pirellulales bacterium]|nr:hypothetical protein [Pirellulales bacterium]
MLKHTSNKEGPHGLTPSKEQIAYNHQHNGFDLDFDDFINRDYQEESYDAIFSVGDLL